ncbi:hypothetical protein LZ24_01136 [Desulfobotulus alkaliphilus]|uniref:Uncharacterized protein n=1 Tax=Desulfobotulus alkaliphilus TaxID=622671 RepID=A0A562S0Q2_9BACT|nr:hypothetical protein LZ24_01136 [Desulfobotulus alkaliphilus]
MLYLISFRKKGAFHRHAGPLGFLMLTGLFGLLPLLFIRENSKKRIHEKKMVREKPLLSGPVVTLAVVAQQNRTNLNHKRKIRDRSEIRPFFHVLASDIRINGKFDFFLDRRTKTGYGFPYFALEHQNKRKIIRI